MVYNVNLLEKLEELASLNQNIVQLPIWDQVPISHKGEALVLRERKVQNVLYISGFKYNLLSVSKITTESDCMVSFFPNFCKFQELSSEKVIGIGKEEEGLYILKHNCINKNGIISFLSQSEPTSSNYWFYNNISSPIMYIQVPVQEKTLYVIMAPYGIEG